MIVNEGVFLREVIVMRVRGAKRTILLYPPMRTSTFSIPLLVTALFCYANN